MPPQTILENARTLLKESLTPDWNGSRTTVTASRKIVVQDIRLPAATSLLKAVSESAQKAKRSRSERLWCFRQAQFISVQKAGDLRRPEKRLEKAVVRRPEENGLGDDWGNQISTASGLSQDRGDSRRNIDLVRRSAKEHYRFIELKVRRGTNTPLSAGIELLEYALLYVWVRQNIGKLRDDETIPDCDASKALLNAKVIELEVLAPDNYYAGYDKGGMERLQRELGRTCVALGEQVEIGMRFRYKTLIDFDKVPDNPSREWLVYRFENPPDHYPSA
jgi:hypothetical protein